MLAVLCSGTLTRDPQRRQSAKGKDYCTALLRVPAEDADAMLCSVIAFGDTEVAALLALKQNDALSVAGRASLRTWEKDGETRTGLSIIADRVLTAYEAGRRRKQARTESVESER